MRSNRRSPFLTAFFNPANLAMLAVIAAASLCAAWWLLPIGLVLWLVMFLFVFRDPTLRFTNLIAGRESLAQRFQSRFDRVEKAQVSLYNSLAAANRKSRSFLGPIQEAVDQVVSQAYRLSQSMTAMENHVTVSRTYRNPETQLAQMEEKVMAASDPSVKQDYEEARKTVEGQVTDLKSMSTLLDRFDAQLVTLASALEGVVTAVVRLGTVESVDLSVDTKSILASVSEQSHQLVEFESQIRGDQSLAQ